MLSIAILIFVLASFVQGHINQGEIVKNRRLLVALCKTKGMTDMEIETITETETDFD